MPSLRSTCTRRFACWYLMASLSVIVFFFQAEDGIRDDLVTGVQTCALPICAEVLRIDPPGWEEPGTVPEVTLGKRCARLDLRAPQDRAVFEQLLAGADVLVHGYRDGALEGLGFGAAWRRRQIGRAHV